MRPICSNNSSNSTWRKKRSSNSNINSVLLSNCIHNSNTTTRLKMAMTPWITMTTSLLMVAVCKIFSAPRSLPPLPLEPNPRKHRKAERGKQREEARAGEKRRRSNRGGRYPGNLSWRMQHQWKQINSLQQSSDDATPIPKATKPRKEKPAKVVLPEDASATPVCCSLCWRHHGCNHCSYYRCARLSLRPENPQAEAFCPSLTYLHSPQASIHSHRPACRVGMSSSKSYSGRSRRRRRTRRCRGGKAWR